MKKISIFIFSLMICGTMFLSLAQAGPLSNETQTDINTLSKDTSSAFNQTTDKNSLSQIMADVINIFLSLLGIIFVVIIVVAGYNWMTAGGNDEKVEKAQKLISRAIMGLVVISAAYAITYFIFARLPN